MTTLSESLRRHFSFFDALLFAAGLSLLFAYFALLPAQHPDSAAATELSEGDAVERAEAFVIENGYIISTDLAEDAQLARDVHLLDSLQATFGRPRTVRVLKEEPEGPLPAFFWQVEWVRRDEGDDALLRVDLDLEGQPYAFHTDARQLPIRRVNRNAVAVLLAAEEGAAAEAPPPAVEAPDSALIALLSFDGALADTIDLDARTGPVVRRVATDEAPATARQMIAQGQPVQLNARAAAVLARHHLGRTLLRDLVFRVDSVRASSRPGLSAARVHLQSAEPHYGQRVEAVVEVSATGGLLALEPRFNPRVDEEDVEETSFGDGESSLSLSVTSGGVYDIVMGVLYAALALMALFMFIRRLNARVVDTKTALRDAFWGGCFVGGMVLVMTAEVMFETIPQFWLAFVILSINVSISGLGGAFLIFLASGAMDSLARSVWPEKLTTLGLVRHSVFRNVPVGAALLRGTFVAFVLAGGTTLLLAMLPEATINYVDGDEAFRHTYMLTTAGYAFAKNAWLSQFLNTTVMLGLGSLLVLVRRKSWVVVPGIALVLLLLQTLPFEVEPLGRYVLLCGFVGLVLAYTFWRFDFITSFLGYLFFGLLWETQNGWMIEGSVVWLDATLAFVTIGVVLLVGLVGALSRKTATEVPTYLPTYIQELAQEERMKGELEIAYHVQASFLPRRMPRVAGLDVAAMCLPALDVGGDYYDFVELGPRRLAVVVGDVSGKGIQAAFYMTLVKGFFQTLCRMIESPAEVLRKLNDLFCENVPRGTFISMIYGVLDVEARTFTFARAGHNPVIFKRSPSQDPELYRPSGMGIGLTSGPRFDGAIEEATIHLRQGDVLVFYTDGFSEAMNARKELYGDQRLAERVSEVGQRNAGEILRAVSEDVHHFMEAAGRHDDMTMVVIKLASRPSFTPGTAVHVERVEA